MTTCHSVSNTAAASYQCCSPHDYVVTVHAITPPFPFPSPPPSSPVRVRDEYGHAAGFAAQNRACLRFVGYFVSASMSQIRPKLANSRLLADTKYSVSYRRNDSCIAAKMLANSRQSSRLNQQRSKSQQSIAARDRRQMLTDIT